MGKLKRIIILGIFVVFCAWLNICLAEEGDYDQAFGQYQDWMGGANNIPDLGERQAYIDHVNFDFQGISPQITQYQDWLSGANAISDLSERQTYIEGINNSFGVSASITNMHPEINLGNIPTSPADFAAGAMQYNNIASVQQAICPQIQTPSYDKYMENPVAGPLSKEGYDMTLNQGNSFDQAASSSIASSGNSLHNNAYSFVEIANNPPTANNPMITEDRLYYRTPEGIDVCVWKNDPTEGNTQGLFIAPEHSVNVFIDKIAEVTKKSGSTIEGEAGDTFAHEMFHGTFQAQAAAPEKNFLFEEGTRGFFLKNFQELPNEERYMIAAEMGPILVGINSSEEPQIQIRTLSEDRVLAPEGSRANFLAEKITTEYLSESGYLDFAKARLAGSQDFPSDKELLGTGYLGLQNEYIQLLPKEYINDLASRTYENLSGVPLPAKELFQMPPAVEDYIRTSSDNR